MLTKLLILPIFFIITGFGEFTDDNMKTPNVYKEVDTWSSQLEGEIASKQKIVKKEKTFADYQVGDNLCGDYNMPFKVGIITNNPPFTWQYEKEYESLNGYYYKTHYDGVLNVFLDKMFASFGSPQYKIFYFKSNKDLEKALQRGEVDIGIGIPYNPDPLLAIDYVYPAFFSNPIIAVFKNKKDAESIKNFYDLKKLKGISAAETEGLADMINSFKTSEKNISIITPNIKATEIYNYLLYNRIDYILTSLYKAMAFNKMYDLKEDIYYSTTLRTQQQLVAFSKNSQCRPYKNHIETFLAQDIFSELEKLYYQQLDKWISKNTEVLPYKERQQVKTKQRPKGQNRTVDQNSLDNIVPTLK